MSDKVCPQISALRTHKDGEKLQLCQWFHDAFLLDPRYHWLAEQLTTGHHDGITHCQRCGTAITKSSNRQRFCPSCSETERKMNKAKIMRHLRARKNKG